VGGNRVTEVESQVSLGKSHVQCSKSHHSIW